MPRHRHNCAHCGSFTGEWGGRLKKCSACRRVTYCSRRCQKEHWALHRSICRREPLHVWWRWVAGRSVPRMAAPLVVLVVGLIAALLAIGMCRLIEPARSSWAVSYRA